MTNRRTNNRWIINRAWPKLMMVFVCSAIVSCTGEDKIPLVVQVSSLSISKLPFVIAEDQGLYDKYGLSVQFITGAPPFEGGRQGDYGLWRRIGEKLGVVDHRQVDIFVDGATPGIVRYTTLARAPDEVSLASTDCIVRSHIIGRHGIRSLEDLKGKRLGVSGAGSTAGFIGRLVAERMGWDPVHDISIVANSHEVDDLRNGVVDATVAYEMGYAVLEQEGYPILADTRMWNDHIGGNSARVRREWLQDGTNREAARRFLMALAEGIALFHQNRELTLRILDDWYGIQDPALADKVYARGAWIPREPYPCHEGIRRTMELYDSNEMRRYTPEHFYDDSIVRELVESGFIDKLYR